jgi:hypothetical protein
VVQVELVEAEIEVLLSQAVCWPEIGGDEHDLAYWSIVTCSLVTSKSSTDSRSQETGGGKTLERHWS